MKVLEAADEESALEQLHARGLTDGLPVVIPTVERVERMVLTGGLAGDLVLGKVGPSGRVATVEVVAANAVMAGCLPDHMPVVIAAARAICDPEFDLEEIQVTTHSAGPLLIVNGPARHACGSFASGFGALGPGHRANASVGRAVRLVMTAVGGGRPGLSDMSLLGQPGKLACCFAEAEEESPFDPLHTTLGFSEDASTVTAVAVEGPHSVIANVGMHDRSGPDRLLGLLAGAVVNLGSNNVWLESGVSVVVLNPGHAAILANAGFDRPAVQAGIAERSCQPGSVLKALDALGPQHPQSMATWRERAAGEEAPERGAMVRRRRPEDVLVVVAGGEGGYSAVFPSWGAAAHGNGPVIKEIELDQQCEVPWMRDP